jgi:hypothetical protein
MARSIEAPGAARSRGSVCHALLVAVLLLATTPAFAVTVVFDSDAQGWLDAAATWPNAGPVFDASGLVAATSTTFVVQMFTADHPEIDQAFMGQTVCRGDLALCPSPYFRGPVSTPEAASERWQLLFSQSVLGVLFDAGLTYNTSAFSLLAVHIGDSPGAFRMSVGLPAFPTSFGFLTDASLTEIEGRQTVLSDGTSGCCPSPLFAVAPTPEPSVALLILSGAAGLVGHQWRQIAHRRSNSRS